jgi:Luciferase-like monooxygenase
MGGLRPFRFGVIHEEPQPAARWARTPGHRGPWLLNVPDPQPRAARFFGPHPAPFVALASASGFTTRLRLGTLVLAVDYRHPVMLAKEAATLDSLSGGRLATPSPTRWTSGAPATGSRTTWSPTGSSTALVRSWPD